MCHVVGGILLKRRQNAAQIISPVSGAKSRRTARLTLLLQFQDIRLHVGKQDGRRKCGAGDEAGRRIHAVLQFSARECADDVYARERRAFVAGVTDFERKR
jgi:hypothetical protein